MRPKICISDLLSDLKRAGSFYFIPVSYKNTFTPLSNEIIIIFVIIAKNDLT